MARGRTRAVDEYGEFWPGYVDVLSTLLLVVTFLMSIFMLAQYFASQEASGKDTALAAPHAADHRAHQPAGAREGQGQIRRGRACRAAGVAGDAEGGERQAVGRRPSARRAGKDSAGAHRRPHHRTRKPEEHLQRGAGQGRSAQPAASGPAPADRRPERGARGLREEGRRKPGAHQGSGRPPQRRARPPGAGAAALPVRLLRPPARAAEGPQGHPRRRRPLRVRVRSAVPLGIRPP